MRGSAQRREYADPVGAGAEAVLARQAVRADQSFSKRLLPARALWVGWWLGLPIVRIVVIGGSGHVGSFLVPRLVRAGHEVINLARGARSPYVDDETWSEVEQISVDRAAEDAAGTFGERVAELEAEVVVDMICFTPDSATALVEALRGRSGHLIHCGTIWRYGASVKQPMEDGRPRRRLASTAAEGGHRRAARRRDPVRRPGHHRAPAQRVFRLGADRAAGKS